MNESKPKTSEATVSSIVSKAWKDPDFKKRLLSDPVAALTDVGVAIPSGVTVKVLENTAKLIHLVLPTEGDLSDEALKGVVGGLFETHPSPPVKGVTLD